MTPRADYQAEPELPALVRSGLELAAELRKPGGTLVLDDLVWGGPPGEDHLKSFWLGHQRLAATEVMTHAPDWAAIIATRREI